jgi:hypothetical protein
MELDFGGLMSRVFGLAATILAMGIAMFIYSKQVQTVSGQAQGGNVQSIANISGVKNDLIGIANAERSYNAQQGRYGSLDELVSANYLTVKRERPPYAYDVQASPGGFRVTATRSTPGGPAQLWIDDTMEVQSSNDSR